MAKAIRNPLNSAGKSFEAIWYSLIRPMPLFRDNDAVAHDERKIDEASSMRRCISNFCIKEYFNRCMCKSSILYANFAYGLKRL